MIIPTKGGTVKYNCLFAVFVLLGNVFQQNDLELRATCNYCVHPLASSKMGGIGHKGQIFRSSLTEYQDAKLWLFRDHHGFLNPRFLIV